MKLRKILCAAAVLCLLWTAAGADAYSYSGTPVNIMRQSAKPYHWEAQLRNNGEEMTWRIGDLFDGYRETRMEHVCWNNESLDDIPEITFYFENATIKDIWYRNMYDSDDPMYEQYARPYRLEVTVWIGDEEFPRGPYVFNRLPDICDPSLLDQDNIDGYRRLSLPEVFTNVTKVDLWIKGWHKGDDAYRSKYIMLISDMAFLPDTLVNLYGSRIFDPDYEPYYPVYPTQAPTWAPTLVPTMAPATPQPLITEAPFKGVQVILKERLATRSGPGTNYSETGSYFQKGNWVKALTSAYDKTNGIWWVQIEMTYDGELRRVYTGVKRLQMSADQVPVEETSEGEAIVNRAVYPYWGPGYGYTMYGEKIPAGTSGTIWQRENLYAQFEFMDPTTHELRRVWIPENALDEDDAVG